MIEIKQFSGLNDDIIAICSDVFVNEQGISYKDVFEGNDNLFVHFCLFDNNYIIGYARISITDGVLHIGRVAVRKEFRGRGVGNKLMDAAEAFGLRHGCEFASLNSQVQAKGFYSRIGYAPCGDVFSEVNIEHIEMRKQLK